MFFVTPQVHAPPAHVRLALPVVAFHVRATHLVLVLVLDVVPQIEV